MLLQREHSWESRRHGRVISYSNLAIYEQSYDLFLKVHPEIINSSKIYFLYIHPVYLLLYCNTWILSMQPIRFCCRCVLRAFLI
jgi:hypothetical protein